MQANDSADKKDSFMSEEVMSSVDSRFINENCRLYVKSPTCYQVKEWLDRVCARFSSRVSDVIREVTEMAQVSCQYTGCVDKEGSVDYVQPLKYADRITDDMLIYHFPLEHSVTGFFCIDQNVPKCMTEICFGGRLSLDTMKQRLPQELCKIDFYLLEKIVGRLQHECLKEWLVLFPTEIPDPDIDDQLSLSKSIAKRVEGGVLPPGVKDSRCVNARFDIRFAIGNDTDDYLSLPLNLLMPLLPLEQGVISLHNKIDSCLSRSTTRAGLMKTIIDLPVELMSITLPFSAVKSLKAGDVIPIEKPRTARVFAENVCIGDAVIAQQSGYLALQISEVSFNGGANGQC